MCVDRTREPFGCLRTAPVAGPSRTRAAVELVVKHDGVPVVLVADAAGPDFDGLAVTEDAHQRVVRPVVGDRLDVVERLGAALDLTRVKQVADHGTSRAEAPESLVGPDGRLTVGACVSENTKNLDVVLDACLVERTSEDFQRL